MKIEELAGFPGKLKGIIHIYTHIYKKQFAYVYMHLCKNLQNSRISSGVLFPQIMRVTDVGRLLHIYFLSQTELLLK